MVKKIILTSILSMTSPQAKEPSPLLQKNCINCHIQQKIPSELIYRRYLLKYSTHKKISKILFSYLINPDKKSSIMPKQFFLKFPEKEALDLNESILKKSINSYFDYFDVRKKLTLP